MLSDISQQNQFVHELKTAILYYSIDLEWISVTVISDCVESQSYRLKKSDELIANIYELREAICRPYTFSSSKLNEIMESFSSEWGPDLLPPLKLLQQYHILTIIPHHFLHYIPFHAIFNNQLNQYLGVAFGLSYCSSTTLLARCINNNRIRSKEYKDWQFSIDEIPPLNSPASPTNCAFLASDASGQWCNEFESLKDLIKSKVVNPINSEDAVIIDSDQSFQRIKFSPDSNKETIPLKEWDLITLICHGYYDISDPENSYLLLNNEIRPIMNRVVLEDNLYRYEELPFIFPTNTYSNNSKFNIPYCMSFSEIKSTLRTNAELVTLIGCNTGNGMIRNGGDYCSFAYEFLKAGNSTTLSNLWELDLNVAREWLSLFLHNWIDLRQPKSIAWSRAIAELLDNSFVNHNIYKWGPIAIFGDWV